MPRYTFSLRHKATGQIIEAFIERLPGSQHYHDYQVVGPGWALRLRNTAAAGNRPAWQTVSGNIADMVIYNAVAGILTEYLTRGPKHPSMVTLTEQEQRISRGFSNEWVQMATRFAVGVSPRHGLHTVIMRRHGTNYPYWIVVIGGQLMGKDGNLYADPGGPPKTDAFSFQTSFGNKEDAYRAWLKLCH